MLRIPADKFAHAVEALMIAAVSATDQQGLKVHADLPRARPEDAETHLRAGTGDSDFNAIRAGTYDYKRIHAIALGAIIALVNGPAHVDDEHHFSAAELKNLGKVA